MKRFFYCSILSLTIHISNGFIYAQNKYTPYPIIFVHGRDSFEGTWDPDINFLKPYFGDKQIFHAVLNAYPGLRSLKGPDGQLGTNDDDVLFPIINQNNDSVNQLHNGRLFVINFQNYWNEDTINPKIITYNNGTPGTNESESNKSAIYKQGYALSKCIKTVLLATGAEKVILVGHSMGGLAIREYLQRKDINGTHIWWDNPYDNVNGHKVAKVVTIGTPHLGCNYALLPLNMSEADRDLVYSYATSAPGAYLFSNQENNIPGAYPNYDVNCNGSQTDWIDGISYNTSFSLVLPLPNNILYTWITSKFGILPDDGVVDLNRQYLYDGTNITPLGISDTLLTDKLHTNEPSDYYSIIRGLDEPNTKEFSYRIESNSTTKGFITHQTYYNPTDFDVYKIVLYSDGFLKINIADYFESGINTVQLLNNNGLVLKNIEYPYFYDGISHYALAGTYYIRIIGQAKPNKSLFPYTLTSKFFESSSPINAVGKMEYFLDSDPGFGNGTPVTLTPGVDITTNFNIPLSGVSTGFHILYVRAKDEMDRWSIPQTLPFYNLISKPQENIVRAEYFIDTDPGFGNGTTLSVNTFTDITGNFNIPLSNLQNGIHTLYVRVKDNFGKWSITQITAFYRVNNLQPKIAKLEYFFDNDPGFGLGTIVQISPSLSDITKIFYVDLACLSSGSHTFYLRAKDTDGKWSLINTKNITISTGIYSIIVAGPANICSGDSVLLKAPSGTGRTYQWKRDGIILNGVSDSLFYAKASGNYRGIIRHHNNGSCTDSTNSVAITVNPLPANAGTISGSATVFQGENSVNYSVSNIPNATSYIWTLPIGATGTITSNNITVNYSPTAVSGNITVRGTNSCGVGAFSSLPISVIPLTKTLQIKVFVEGLYMGSGMMHESSDFDPLSENFSPKWDSGISDTLTVVLYNNSYDAFMAKYPGVYLHTDGNLMIPGISASLNGSYYITIFHRNSVPITSATPQSFTSSTITYDFTYPIDQAYGAGFAPQKYLGDGFYGMYAGELDHDAYYAIDGSDVSVLDPDIIIGPLGYILTDLNGDGVVDGSDMSLMDANSIFGPLFWNPNIAK